MDSILSEGKYRSSLADGWKEASRKREREREMKGTGWSLVKFHGTN